VALARSLAKAPKLLLLDEPMGALDKKLRQETQFELMDIQEKTHTTFVIVTHDQEEAMTVASRVAVMDEGKLIQVATPDQIYESPNSVYVADFIGDVNIIEGRARPAGAERYEIVWSSDHAPILAASGKEFSEGQKCHVAVRPEKLTISVDKPEGADNALRGTILDIAYLGNISTYHVQLSSGLVIKAQTANTRRIARRAFNWDDPVWLSWTATAGVLLAD
jgi:putrescine transport system ATP-binding protein